MSRADVAPRHRPPPMFSDVLEAQNRHVGFFNRTGPHVERSGPMSRNDKPRNRFSPCGAASLAAVHPSSPWNWDHDRPDLCQTCGGPRLNLKIAAPGRRLAQIAIVPPQACHEAPLRCLSCCGKTGDRHGWLACKLLQRHSAGRIPFGVLPHLRWRPRSCAGAHHQRAHRPKRHRAEWRDF